MTVSELRDMLSDLPPDAKVLVADQLGYSRANYLRRIDMMKDGTVSHVSITNF